MQNNKINIWKEFIKIFKASKKEFMIKFLTSILIRGILLVIPVLFSAAVNYATKEDYTMALIFILISVVVTVLYRLSEGINQQTFYNLYNSLYTYYNSRGIAKTNDNSTFSLSRFTIGQYTNMLTSDVDVIASFFANGVIRFVQLLEFFVIYAYFLSLDFVLFITAIAVSIIIICIIPFVSKPVEELNSNKKIEYDKLLMSCQEYFNNIKDIKCFNIFNKVSPITKEQTQKFLIANSKYNVRYYWNNQFFLLAIEIFRLIAVAYGIFLITQGNLEIGSLLIIYNYYQKIIDNFSTILTISVEYTNLKVSLSRFNHLVEYSSHRNIDDKKDVYISDGKINFNQILYGYKNDPTFIDVTFEIEPNTITAITGKSGTGKTGIFDLLLKLNRQHQGEILIDDTNINEIPDNKYFSNISLLRKGATFFNMSIRDNLLLIENDEDKIYEICKKLGIHDDIRELKNGYDTIMNENDNISSSLKQMIAVARTILKSSKIMLFENALVGIDEKMQDTILNILNELKTEHTIVIITHDKNVLKSADKIIVMDAKHVVEEGTLTELIRNRGKYYELFNK